MEDAYAYGSGRAEGHGRARGLNYREPSRRTACQSVLLKSDNELSVTTVTYEVSRRR